ncbi:MAG: hypothetical protein AAFO75_08595, partial [Pseudomonadota bacterium]
EMKAQTGPFLENPLGKIGAARWLALLIAMCAVVVTPRTTLSAEFCVTCSQPTATYLCKTDIGGSKFKDAGAKLFCISQLAKQFQHAKCAAKRAEHTTGCLGKIVTLSSKNLLGAATGNPPPKAPGVNPAAPINQPPLEDDPAFVQRPAPPPGTPIEPPADIAQPQTQPKKPDAVPKTVEELAKQATENSQENLKKAGETVVGAVKDTGDAVGTAAKKTWDCITSLLTDCLN